MVIALAMPFEYTWVATKGKETRTMAEKKNLCGLIPTPSAEANSHLLDLANGLWLEMKDDLYHAFSFVSRHFTSETLQNVYDLCGTRETGLLDAAIARAGEAGTTAAEALQQKHSSRKRSSKHKNHPDR